VNARWHRVGVVAREEFRQALESRWLFGFTALLTALVLGLSFFGMAQSREVGFQGFARVTLSLMNLVLFIVPLTGLMLGVTSVTGGSGAESSSAWAPRSRWRSSWASAAAAWWWR
jgi:Cu-processing system permease protein